MARGESVEAGVSAAGTPNAAGAEPLANLRVLELASLMAAPFAGRLFRDFGASVVKVEDPKTGDQGRQWGPYGPDGTSLQFIRNNAGKRSVSIDLRREEGRELVRLLIPHFDIVIENFRPGRLETWGLDYEELASLNPRLVLVRLSGFGQVGSLRKNPGFGTIADAFSGFAYVNGWPYSPPTLAPFGLADHLAGVAAAYGALVALVRRNETGRGAEVDAALFEPLMVVMGELITRYSALGVVQERTGSEGAAASPRGMFQAADGGWVAIAGSSQRIAERVFTAIGRPELIEDSRYATNDARVANNEEVDAIVSAWVGSHTRDEALDILARYEVAASAVSTAKDIVENQFLWERGTLVQASGEHTGGFAVPGRIVRIADAPPVRYGDPPRIGEHTAEVLQELLDLGQTRLDELHEAGVIRLEGSVARR